MSPSASQPPPPTTSALTRLIASNPPLPSQNEHQHALALQVQHNLQYQHDWTNLQIHNHSPLTQKPLPRPLISGLPPHRIYVHPDEQIELLQKGVKEEDVEVGREWVLPTHLREKWTLRRLAEVFDAVGVIPPGNNEGHGPAEVGGTRRGGKKVLLATLGDDSTVVYYIVHDGIVKPRQN